MNETVLRTGVFVVLFVALIAAQRLWPRRAGEGSSWRANLGIFLLGAVLTRLLVVIGAMAAAQWADARGWGVFNVIDSSVWLTIGASIILLDLAVWAQHVTTHRIPLLWRLHEVHHADGHFDVTTGLRFHPGEIALSLVYKSGVVVLVGAPGVAVVAFEILLNSGSMFEHANVKLPKRVDAALRKVIVTPDMHRVHHSTIREEADSNYGFCLSIWDRIFRTYRDQPALGHDAMEIGVAGVPRDLRLSGLLSRPLASRARPTPLRYR